MFNFRKIFAPRDMTKGAPWKSILIFVIPMLIGNLAQQLYSTVDSVVVGKYVGDNALAAVGKTFPITMLFLVIVAGIAVGVGIRVSQYFGAKDREKLSLVVGNCISLAFIASVVTGLLGYFFVDYLLVLLNTPKEIISMSSEYLKIIFLGISGMLFYNIFNSILRGLGDSFSALLFLIFSTFLNIVLDLWFVISFKMGVTGVAIATVISQSVSAILSFIKLTKTEALDIKKKYLRPDRATIVDIFKLGLPSGINQGVLSLAMLLIVRLENSFGAAFVTLASVVIRVDGFAVMPTFTFGQALTTFIGQNVGAKKYDRLKLGAKQGTALAISTVAFMTFIILIFGKDVMHIFTDTLEIVEQGAKVLRILALGYIAVSVIQCMSGVMRGAGDTVTPMYISIFTSVVLRVSLGYLLVHLSKTPEKPLGEPFMIYYSLLITWVLGAVLNFYFYRKGRWRKKLIDEMEINEKNG